MQVGGAVDLTGRVVGGAVADASKIVSGRLQDGQKMVHSTQAAIAQLDRVREGLGALLDKEVRVLVGAVERELLSLQRQGKKAAPQEGVKAAVCMVLDAQGQARVLRHGDSVPPLSLTHTHDLSLSLALSLARALYLSNTHTIALSHTHDGQFLMSGTRTGARAALLGRAVGRVAGRAGGGALRRAHDGLARRRR